MDNDVVIAVNNVSKVYQLYDKPADRLKQALFWRFGKRYGREFWALKDVSFEVRRGETIGIIGRNGSGKSTLLQIIAGTLQPTSGSVQVRGRVAALLELGSGFNPEFTGRENVYMAGALLGLSEREIDAHFDEIDKFAEIGDFIDQPVKLYSSGMFVRLAFAVQAVLPKDILIVDEALAVGDASFQRKCYQRLEQFRAQGGTVLLVTHDVQTVVRECSCAMLLSDGHLIEKGDTKDVTDFYYEILFNDKKTKANDVTMSSISNDVLARIYNERLSKIGELDIPTPYVEFGGGYAFSFCVDFNQNNADLFASFSTRLSNGVVVGGASIYLPLVKSGVPVQIQFQMDNINLLPGQYFISCNVHKILPIKGVDTLARKVDILQFDVIQKAHKKEIKQHGMVGLVSGCDVILP